MNNQSERDKQLLDSIVNQIGKPLHKAADATVKVADRIDSTLAAGEAFFTYTPWVGGGIVGLFIGLLIARYRK